MYVQRNIETRSCDHCWSGKAINITYSECMFVVLGAPYIVICGLPGCTKFNILSHKRQGLRKHKVCVLIFSKSFV